MNKTLIVYLGTFLLLISIIFAFYYLAPKQINGTNSFEEKAWETAIENNNLKACEQLETGYLRASCIVVVTSERAIIENDKNICNDLKIDKDKGLCEERFNFKQN